MADNVIPFPRLNRDAARRPATVLGAPPSDLIPADDGDAVTDLLRLLEAHAFDAPVARGLIDISGRPVVGVVVGKVLRYLRPEQARVAACALVIENPYAGAVGMANQLSRAADDAQRLQIARTAGRLIGDRVVRNGVAIDDGAA